MTATWRLLETWDEAPGFNMALDEAMLLGPGANDSPPTLRFYTWKPAALSLGYFQRVADVPGVGSAESVVRRMTGGGAIHHANELTFSLTAPQTNPLYAGPVAESYERVHSWIADCLSELGVAAAMRGSQELSSDREGTGMCFHKSTPIDLAWGNAKGVGSAQRRRAGRVLHHGSIKIGTTELEGPIATLRADANHSPAALAERLARGFERCFGHPLVAGRPTQEELEHARRRAAHFESASFVGLR